MQIRGSAAMGEITTSVHDCVVCKAHHSTMNDDEGGPTLFKAHHSFDDEGGPTLMTTTNSNYQLR